ncbi:MAG: hypothetical protein J6L77_04085 [Coprococcus sp.]|nr:hypothetical protein [Coprococcus sp.]
MIKLENIEEAIKEIFVDLFGVDDLEYEDNFFDLEINSLLATQLLYRIKQEFNSNLSLQELFEKTTIKQLAEFIIEEQEANGDNAESTENEAADDKDLENVVDQLSDSEINDLLKQVSEE